MWPKKGGGNTDNSFWPIKFDLLKLWSEFLNAYDECFVSLFLLARFWHGHVISLPFVFLHALLRPVLPGNHSPLGDKSSGSTMSWGCESNVGYIAWNNDRRRRITSTVTTNLVTMDTIVNNQVIIVAHDGVLNVEVVECYFKPGAGIRSCYLPVADLDENKMLL